ncbi:hypothetical protein DRO30_01330 [Candidatus Bathyarchaeota archaeon]|nr:MAG: hypothetical protein DRO30_01330 [Candidatus Bathyarchaeota archaeon]
MKLKYENIKILRDAGFSYKKIAKIYGTHQGTVYRIFKKGPSYSEEINSKKKMKEREVFPIWQFVSPEILYIEIPNIISRFVFLLKLPTIVEFEILDYVLDFLYSRDSAYWKKIKNPNAFALYKAREITVNWPAYLSRQAKEKIIGGGGCPKNIF